MKTQAINILLVEDDEVDVMNVKRAFSKNNILNKVYVASNGIEALNMLRGHDEKQTLPFPLSNLLILLDMNMPKMGGLEFLAELRKDTKLKGIPVVILSSSNEEMEKVQAYNLNVAGYIIKPVVFNNFVEKMAVLNKYWTICEMP